MKTKMVYATLLAVLVSCGGKSKKSKQSTEAKFQNVTAQSIEGKWETECFLIDEQTIFSKKTLEITPESDSRFVDDSFGFRDGPFAVNRLEFYETESDCLNSLAENLSGFIEATQKFEVITDEVSIIRNQGIFNWKAKMTSVSLVTLLNTESYCDSPNGWFIGGDETNLPVKQCADTSDRVAVTSEGLLIIAAKEEIRNNGENARGDIYKRTN